MAQQEEVVTAADETAEEAAFEAGFNATDIEPVASESTTEPIEGSAQEEQGSTQPPAQAGSLTPADVEALIARVRDEERSERQRLHDRVFGTIGEMKQKINDIKSTVLSPQARARLQGEFPELAEMLFDQAELEQQAAQQQPQQKAQTPDVTSVVAQTTEELKRDLERRLLTRDHPDWQQVTVSDTFQQWKSSLPADQVQALDTSWDADFISSKLTEYKAWTAAQSKKAGSQRQNKDRLEAAVMPQGVPRGPSSGITNDDEEAAMLASFRGR